MFKYSEHALGMLAGCILQCLPPNLRFSELGANDRIDERHSTDVQDTSGIKTTIFACSGRG
jgi:hypothetical protein